MNNYSNFEIFDFEIYCLNFLKILEVNLEKYLQYFILTIHFNFLQNQKTDQ